MFAYASSAISIVSELVCVASTARQAHVVSLFTVRHKLIASDHLLSCMYLKIESTKQKENCSNTEFLFYENFGLVRDYKLKHFVTDGEYYVFIFSTLEIHDNWIKSYLLVYKTRERRYGYVQ